MVTKRLTAEEKARIEAREYLAEAGRWLLELAIERIGEAKEWRMADLVRLADLGRKMEMVARFGPAAAVASAPRAVAAAAGVDLDEWDALAVQLHESMPPG